jgi:nitroreductase
MDADNAQRLQWLVEHRHSSRARYDPSWHVTEPELERIVDAARWAPTAHNMQTFRLVVVDDRAVLDKLAAVRSTVSPAFIIENFRQLSWSPEELATRRVGIQVPTEVAHR